jgi:hypothetical protein
MRFATSCLLCVALVLFLSHAALAKPGGGGGKGGGGHARGGQVKKHSGHGGHAAKSTDHTKVKDTATTHEHGSQKKSGDRLAMHDANKTKEHKVKKEKKPKKDKTADEADEPNEDSINDEDALEDDAGEDGDEVAHTDHPGKGIGRHVREWNKQGLTPEERKEAIKRLQQEHGIAKGRFKNESPTTGDGDTGGANSGGDGGTDGGTDTGGDADTGTDSDEVDE